MFYTSYLKPVLDFIFSALLLLILSPVFILLIVLLGIFQRGNVFFVQRRVGFNEGIFRIIKFKTMRDEYDQYGLALPDNQRLTWIGRLVRKSSLDELPQLLNVLKGDMSFIGPRPLLVEYLPLYNHSQRQRHSVKPGITGWAQVNGRNDVSWQERFEHDIWYVNNRSLRLDLKILFLTVRNVLLAEGISGKGVPTMEKFKGN
jgi:undecaprenyl phosphate N,N'-diacetylbacillosamine 1-phosphate transferase